MSDTKTPDGKTLSVGGKSTLSLKPRTETGTRAPELQPWPQQAGGRRGQEAPRAATASPRLPRRLRPHRLRAKRAASAPAQAVGQRSAGGARPRPAAPAAPAPKSSGVVLRTLTDEERNRRAHALGDARLREAEERKIAEEEAKIRAQRDAIEKSEREAAEARKREEDDRRKHDEETKKKADEVAKKRFGEGETTTTTAARRGRARPAYVRCSKPKKRKRRNSAAAPAARCAPAAPPQRPTRAAKTATERPRGRLTLVTALTATKSASVRPRRSIAASSVATRR